MQKNLISISQFCSSNKVSIEFLPNSFLVKGLHTGAMLLRRHTKDGVYEWLTSTPLIAFSTIKTTSFDWHHKLGHLAFPILKHIVSSNHLGLSSSPSSDFSCNACLCKSQIVFFQLFHCLYSTPSNHIFGCLDRSNSINQWLQILVIFIDHFTKYIWFYPLKHKSEVKTIFIRFKAITENHIHLLKLCSLTMVVSTLP